MRRVPQKRDLSEKIIVDFLRQAGWSVLPISVRNGPDLVAGKHGINLLLECKTGKGKLRPGQVQWGIDWKGHAPYVIRTVEEAQALTKAIEKLRTP